MKIALVVPWEEATPPERYGGIELVVHNIALNLVNLGHEVTVLATGDSNTAGTVVPIFPESTRKLPYSADKTAREGYTFLGISRAVEILNKLDVDIVHNHLGWRFLIFHKFLIHPTISTMHLNLDNPYEQDIYRLVPDHPYVSISDSQREPLPDLNYINTIYNGIRVSQFEFNADPEDYLVFLGSFTAHKGPDEAIKIAKATGKKLIMAGKIDPLEQKFFDKKIKPHIDNKHIRYIGEVNHKEKDELLRNASALLMPIKWREPFGLVMVEAMACGTPVIAMRMGAVPEVITDGVTGYICADVDCMIRCTKKIHKINRQNCRDEAEKRFSAERMSANYIKAYAKVLNLTEDM